MTDDTPAPGNWNDKIIAEFRANDGTVGGPFEGANLLLLTTTGAKTGRKHTTPVMYFPDGDRLLVIASFAGQPRNPAWYHNLVANPEITVEIGTESYAATAAVLEKAERDRLWERVVSAVPGFGEYQAKTDRTIPIVAIQRTPQ